jgi:Interferon-induced transmembrane protein
MHCTNCGQPRADNATTCASCGERVRRFPAPPAIPNYLVQAILVTLCCCVPVGIVAVVYAAQVNGRLAAGDIAGAQQASRNAKMWSWIAFGLGAVIGLIYVVTGIFSAFGES